MNKVLALMLFLGMGCGSSLDAATQADLMRTKENFQQEIARLERQNEYFEARLGESRRVHTQHSREALACAWAMSYVYNEFGEDVARHCAEEDEYSCDLLEFAYVCGMGGANIYSDIRQQREESTEEN